MSQATAQMSSPNGKKETRPLNWDYVSFYTIISIESITMKPDNYREHFIGQTSDFLFANTGMSDGGVGAILLIISLVAMCLCLTGMVKLLNSLMKGNIARIIKKVINAKFKKPFGWVTGRFVITLLHSEIDCRV